MVPHVVESEDCNVDMVVSSALFKPLVVVSRLLFRLVHVCSTLVLSPEAVVSVLDFMVPHVVESEDCSVDMVDSRLLFKPLVVVSRLLFKLVHVCSTLVLIPVTVVSMLDLMFPHAVVMEDFTASIVVLTLVFMPVSAFVMMVEICVQTVPASEEMPVQQVLSVPLISETFVLKLVPRVDKAVLMVVWIAVQ